MPIAFCLVSMLALADPSAALAPPPMSDVAAPAAPSFKRTVPAAGRAPAPAPVRAAEATAAPGANRAPAVRGEATARPAPVVFGSVAEPAPVEAQPPYAGLSLAPSAQNPLPAPGAAKPSLLWTGFTPNDNGGEIFLQTSTGVSHELESADGVLRVWLRNCRINARNNARPIDTSFFTTPVRAVSARQRKRDVEISVALKAPARPVVRTVPGPGGTQMIVLGFTTTKENNQVKP